MARKWWDEPYYWNIISDHHYTLLFGCSNDNSLAVGSWNIATIVLRPSRATKMTALAVPDSWSLLGEEKLPCDKCWSNRAQDATCQPNSWIPKRGQKSAATENKRGLKMIQNVKRELMLSSAKSEMALWRLSTSILSEGSRNMRFRMFWVDSRRRLRKHCAAHPNNEATLQPWRNQTSLVDLLRPRWLHGTKIAGARIC